MIMTALMIRITCVLVCVDVSVYLEEMKFESSKKKEKIYERTGRHGNQCNMFQYDLKQNSVKL